MRQQISQESQLESVPGQVWYPGSHVWDEEPIPIFLNSEYQDWRTNKIGTATDIRREDDGRITAEIEYEVDAVPPLLATTVFCIDTEWHMFEDILFITKGHIKSLFLTIDCPWAPGWSLKNYE